MKKRLTALMLVFAMIFTMAVLTACGGGQGDQGEQSEGRTFVMGIDPEYPPFSYLGDNGEYTGFDVDVARAVCDKLGWELQIFELNWDNRYIQLDNNECDCVWSGMTILESTKEEGYVLSKPYFDNSQVLMVKADSGIASSADLAGKDVGVQLGTSGDILLSEDLAELAGTFNSVVRSDSFLKCFTELDGGAVDAVLVDAPVAASYVAEHEGFVILDETLGGEQYGICFRSGDQELCDAVEGAIQELVADGTYKQIAEKTAEETGSEEFINGLIFLR